jgi:predicted acylesterase/phospholipase RssA
VHHLTDPDTNKCSGQGTATGPRGAPAIAKTVETLREAGIREPIGIVLADGGYWNSPAISEVRGQGIDVLIPTQVRRRTAPRKLSPRQGEEARRIEGALPEAPADRRARLCAHEISSGAATASSAAASPPVKPSGS